MSMKKVSFGTVSAFGDETHRCVEVDGVEVAIFRLDDAFVAYENICPHMGGPVCQGKVLPQVEEQIEGDKTSTGLTFSKTERNVVCPWHGWEFNLRTGAHPGNPRYKLRRLHVQIEGEEVFVELPPERRMPRADLKAQV
jgi:nitrite reductase (NADH) small subunit